MRRSVSKSSKIIASTCVIIAISAWALLHSEISAAKALQAVGSFKPTDILISFTLCSVQIFAMAVRVRYLFKPQLDPGLGVVTYGFTVGQAVNTFVPARAGDVVKAILFNRESRRTTKPSLLQSAGVLLADRVVDISALALLIIVSGAYKLALGHVSLFSSSPEVIITVGGLGIVVVATAVWFISRRLVNIKQWLCEVRDGLSGLRYPGRVTIALFASLAAWTAEAGSLDVLASAQNIPVDLTRAIFVLLVLNLAIAIPVSIASVGALEAAVIFALGMFGATIEQGLAVATVHHAMLLAAVSISAGMSILAFKWRLAMPYITKSRLLV